MLSVIQGWRVRQCLRVLRDKVNVVITQAPQLELVIKQNFIQILNWAVQQKMYL